MNFSDTTTGERERADNGESSLLRRTYFKPFLLFLNFLCYGGKNAIKKIIMANIYNLLNYQEIFCYFPPPLSALFLPL